MNNIKRNWFRNIIVKVEFSIERHNQDERKRKNKFNGRKEVKKEECNWLMTLKRERRFTLEKGRSKGGRTRSSKISNLRTTVPWKGRIITFSRDNGLFSTRMTYHNSRIKNNNNNGAVYMSWKKGKISFASWRISVDFLFVQINR